MEALPRLLIIPTALATLATFACKGSTTQTSAADSVSSPAQNASPERAGYSRSQTGTSQPTGSHVQKNGGRDAAIGAGAGALVGVATSKDKLKGGVIGAAAGGILGGVIGNNVDTKRVPNSH